MKRNNGYIALVSALIIAGVIILFVATVGLSSFFARSYISDSYYKERSRTFAEGCAQAGLLKLAQNASYAGNETVNVTASDTCRIVSVVASGTGKILTVQGAFQDAYTNLKITVASGTINQWEEVVQ